MNARRPRFRQRLLSAVYGLLLLGGAGGLNSCMKAPDPMTMGGASSGAGGSASSGQASAIPQLEVTGPEGWVVTEPQHSFYLNTWQLPAGGIANFSYFGNKPEIVEDNLTRWVGQFQSADGQPIEQVEKFSLDDAPYETTLIFVEGTMVATSQVGGGDPREGWMLIGGVVMAPQGQLYLKILGPRDQLHPQIGAVQKMLREMKVK